MQELLWQAANTGERTSVKAKPTKYAPQRQVWTQTGPRRRRHRSERKEEVTKRWDLVDQGRILYAVVRRDLRVERWHAVSSAQPSSYNHTDRRTSKPSTPEWPWCVWIPGKPVMTEVCGAHEQGRRYCRWWTVVAVATQWQEVEAQVMSLLTDVPYYYFFLLHCTVLFDWTISPEFALMGNKTLKEELEWTSGQ